MTAYPAVAPPENKQKFYRLTPGNPTAIVGLEFEASKVYVSNPTSSPVLLRVGSPEIPNSFNADITVPGLGKEVVPVIGREFGLAFSDASLLSIDPSANTASVATVIFLTEAKPTPQFGAASFQSLSISDLSNGLTTFTGTTVVPTKDIGAWGGAQIFVSPDSGSGQGVIAVNVGSSPTALRTLGVYAFWPNVPTIINVPRAVRYMQIVINATAIVGEPAISGFYSIRATIDEIQNLTYNPGSQAITKTFALAGLQSVQYQFVTVGLPSVSIAAIATVGTVSSASMTFLVEASADLVNWRRVTYRNQRMSQGITLYRALGNLDLFIRVTIFETGGVQLNGTLYLSIPPEADLGYILNTIQQSLGDADAPTNTNQDIYHELDSIRLNEIAINTNTGNINTNVAAINTNTANLYNLSLIRLPSIDVAVSNLQSLSAVRLPAIDLNTANLYNLSLIRLPSIDSTLGSMNTTLTNLYSVSNTRLPSIDVGIDNINNSRLVATNTNLTTIINQLTTEANFRAAYSQQYTGQTGVAAGAWTYTGVAMTAGYYVITAQASVTMTAGPAGTLMAIAFGTAGAVLGASQFYLQFAMNQYAGSTICQGMPMKYDSQRAQGIQVPGGGNNGLWVFSQSAGTVAWQVIVSS